MVKMSDDNNEVLLASGDSDTISKPVNFACTSTDVDAVTTGGDSDSMGSLSLSVSPAPLGTVCLPDDWNGVEQSDADSGVANGSMPTDCDSAALGFDSACSVDGASDAVSDFTPSSPQAPQTLVPPEDTVSKETTSPVINSPGSVGVNSTSPKTHSTPVLSGAAHESVNSVPAGGSGTGSTTVSGDGGTTNGTPAHSTASGSGSQQYVVNVHVNAGETFSVRVGDRVQLIHGPATVRMVSNSGPPVPMPMQVPPGHMVQQIVDENGILTHVILSPQPPGIPAPPNMMGAANCTPIYQPYGYAPYPPPFAPHHHPGIPTRHIHPMMGHVHHVPPAAPMPPPSHHHQCNSHAHHPPHSHPAAPAPQPVPRANHTAVPVQPPPPSVQTADDRAMRTRARLRNKLKGRNPNDGGHQRKGPSQKASSTAGSHETPAQVESKSGNSSFEDGQEQDDEMLIILHDMLSKLESPKVSEIEARSALIQLTAPVVSSAEVDVESSEFLYELSLSEKRDGAYTVMYSGDATEITLRDLKPASDYFVRVCCMLDNVRGDSAEPVSFTTQAAEPEPPAPPKLMTKTKTSLQLKWNAAVDNGSKVTAYILECDQGKGDSNFTEVYSGNQKQYKVVKLLPSTSYAFRIAAVNGFGKSRFSDPVTIITSGTVPPQTDPPMLSECCVKALTISWIRRPCDETFTLQMDDEATGHGFLTVYNGSDLSHKISHLRRNTEYKFRLQATNEEGSGKWSDVVCFRTLPDRPQAPPKPQLKGKLTSVNFRVVWDEPRDTGGVDVQDYQVQLDAGNGYQMVHRTCDREFIADQLEPGHTYRIRVCCYSSGGQSDWSEVQVVTTLPVSPGQCKPPRLHGRPKATSLTIVWEEPDYDGGALISEYTVQMNGSDSVIRDVYRGHDLQCSVASLLPGRSYSFQVRASNKAGWGVWSDCLDVVTAAGVPDMPGPPEVSCKSPHVAIVSWTEPPCNGSPITDYHLEWQMRDEQDFMPLYSGPATMYELSKLCPATSYGFRVQAVNTAGIGPFSAITWCQTQMSSPCAVTAVRVSATETTIHLSWKEPVCNGSKILSYNIDIGDLRQLISVDSSTLEFVVTELIPETTYKVRVQAVNAIGVGAFSSPVRVTTRALPPPPPSLECTVVGSNSLKLKWGDGKNPDLIRYSLEMRRDSGSFQQVYHGTSHIHKVAKLNESTDYHFRIFAINDAGEGPPSSTFSFRTTKAPPPAMKAPKMTDITLTSCSVEWVPLKPLGPDNILYVLQLQRLTSRDQNYHEIYRGTDRVFRIEGLVSKSDYQIRVGAVRQLTDETGTSITISGPFSPGLPFTTLGAVKTPAEPGQSQSVSALTKQAAATGRKGLSEQQQSVLILLVFTIIAVGFAVFAKWLIDWIDIG